MKRNQFSLIHPLYIAILIKSCYLKQCFIKIKTLLNRGSSYLSTITDYRYSPVRKRQLKDTTLWIQLVEKTGPDKQNHMGMWNGKET